MLVNPEVVRTLWDLKPVSFYGKNKILYLVTGLCLQQYTGILSLILQSVIFQVHSLFTHLCS